MNLTSAYLNLEVVDVTGREISLYTNRITSLEHLECVVHGFVTTCREQIIVPNTVKLCDVRPTRLRVM